MLVPCRFFVFISIVFSLLSLFPITLGKLVWGVGGCVLGLGSGFLFLLFIVDYVQFELFSTGFFFLLSLSLSLMVFLLLSRILKFVKWCVEGRWAGARGGKSKMGKMVG